MWTLENRAKYNRDHLRYPSDLTDHEWAYVEPLIPPAKPGGGKRRTDMRAVMDGVMYILSTIANGAICRRTFRRTARCTTILSGGNAMVRWIAFITTLRRMPRKGGTRGHPTAAIIDSQS